MPPKKRKRKQPTQSQRQSQKVTINIGSKSAPRKRSGRGGLPPPSHQHNLAPTFITAPQVDYTPLLMAITQQTRSLQPEPVRNPVTPLSAVIATQTATQNAQQMAGEDALRRAEPTFEVDEFEVEEVRAKPLPPFRDPLGLRRPGPTAGNFQPQPSLADERLETQDYDDRLKREVSERKTKIKQSALQQAEQAMVQPQLTLKEIEQQRITNLSRKPSSVASTQSGVTSMDTQSSLKSEQELTGFGKRGAPTKQQKLAKKTAEEVSKGKQTTLPFVRQGL
jgi:hypothetical protein